MLSFSGWLRRKYLWCLHFKATSVHWLRYWSFWKVCDFSIFFVWDTGHTLADLRTEHLCPSFFTESCSNTYPASVVSDMAKVSEGCSVLVPFFYIHRSPNILFLLLFLNCCMTHNHLSGVSALEVVAFVLFVLNIHSYNLAVLWRFLKWQWHATYHFRLSFKQLR